MKQFFAALPLTFGLILGSFALSFQANAVAANSAALFASTAPASSALLQSVHHERRYHDDDDYEVVYEYEREYRRRKYHEPKRHKRRNRCHTAYSKKYVCKQPEPRCLRQRECIWYYGKEYCRYVRKCSYGEKRCKYISVPKRKCW